MADEMTNTTTATAGEATQTTQTGQTTTQAEQSPLTMEAIEKLVQSRVDKNTAELGKKIATLQKENESLKKDKMTAEQLKQYEDEQTAKQLSEREKAITDRENRYYALNNVLKANISVSNEIADKVVSVILNPVNDNEGIDEKIKTLTEWANRIKSETVDKTFKANGRVPNGGGTSGTETKENNIAVEIGKRAAEAAKKSNDILNYYYGGKK